MIALYHDNHLIPILGLGIEWNERAYFSTRKVKLDYDYLSMVVLVQDMSRQTLLSLFTLPTVLWRFFRDIR